MLHVNFISTLKIYQAYMLCLVTLKQALLNCMHGKQSSVHGTLLWRTLYSCGHYKCILNELRRCSYFIGWRIQPCIIVGWKQTFITKRCLSFRVSIIERFDCKMLLLEQQASYRFTALEEMLLQLHQFREAIKYRPGRNHSFLWMKGFWTVWDCWLHIQYEVITLICEYQALSCTKC